MSGDVYAEQQQQQQQPPPESTADVLWRINSQEVEKNKENLQQATANAPLRKRAHFNETQEGAQRIDFDEASEDDGSRPVRRIRLQKGRARDEEDGEQDEDEDEDDEEDAFEADTRSVNVKRKARAPFTVEGTRVPQSQTSVHRGGVQRGNTASKSGSSHETQNDEDQEARDPASQRNIIKAAKVLPPFRHGDHGRMNRRGVWSS